MSEQPMDEAGNGAHAPGAVRAVQVSLRTLRARTRLPGEASFFFFDQGFQRNCVKLLPGEYYVSDEDMILTTVLGSCIAACLWDSRARVGGMNHFMLPEGGSTDRSGRYGAYAMEILINELLQRGARREALQAKVFGGGRVLRSSANIGERNAVFVREYLATERIPLVSEDMLDVHPRKVVFFPLSGKAMVKRLVHVRGQVLAAREAHGSVVAVAQARHGGAIDLF